MRFGMSNQIKSNQIKLYFPISHVPYQREYQFDFPEFEWVKEDLNNHQNTSHISFHFNSIYILFMINVLSKLSWPLIVLRLYRSSPSRAQQLLNEMVCSFGRSRMRNEMKMNNHHILSNTAIWQFLNEQYPKVTISNDGRSKTSFSFSFSFKSHFILSFFLFTHLLTRNQHI